MPVLDVIPARGGSKSVPRKNLAPVEGRPLLAYVVDAARSAKRPERFLVSTEDEEIAQVAKELGAEVPFQHPHELARDEVSIVPAIAASKLSSALPISPCCTWESPKSVCNTTRSR